MNNKDIKNSIINTIQTEAKELERLINYLDYKDVSKTIKLISKCNGNVLITGCGTSAQAAKKIVHSLNCINISAFYLNPSDAVHGSIGTIRKKDIVIFISKGGNTSELTNFVQNIKQKKAKIIYVGENNNSILGKNADIILKVKIETEPDEYNMLATARTLSVISLFDSICIALMKYNKFKLKDFEVNHPKGAVGERLKNRRH